MIQKFSFPFNKMAYSFSADAVQYSTGDAYYLRSQAGTEGPVVIDANVEITGDVTIDKDLAVVGDIVSRDGTAGRVALQLTGSPANPSVVFGDVTAPGQFCALNYDKVGATMSLIGSNPTFVAIGGLASGAGLDVSQGGSLALAVNDTMDVRVPVLGRATGTFWSGGSGKVQLSGGGSGPTAFGTVQSFANDGTTITPLVLQPAGGSVDIPSLADGSLQMDPAIPNIVESAGQNACGTFVIAGVRIAWGLTGNGTSPTVNFKLEGASPPTPDDAWFSQPPLVFATPEQNGAVVGYCTPATLGGASHTRNQCNIANTTSGGTAFGTRTYWIAIGPATII